MAITGTTPHEYKEPEGILPPYLCLLVTPVTAQRIGRDCEDVDEPVTASSDREIFDHSRPKIQFRMRLFNKRVEFRVSARFGSLSDFDPKAIESQFPTPGERNDLLLVRRALDALLATRAFVYAATRRWDGTRDRQGALPTIEDEIEACLNLRLKDTAVDLPLGGAEFIASLLDLHDPESAGGLTPDAVRIDARIAALEAVRANLFSELFTLTRPLEQSYRLIGLFFENARPVDGPDERSVQLAILDADPAVIDENSNAAKIVASFIDSRNDSWAFHNSLHGLVMPGRISEGLTTLLMEITGRHRVTLFSDYEGGLCLRPSNVFEAWGGDFLRAPCSPLLAAMVAQVESAGRNVSISACPPRGIPGQSGPGPAMTATGGRPETMWFRLESAGSESRFVASPNAAVEPDWMFTAWKIAAFVDCRVQQIIRNCDGVILNRDSVEYNIERPANLFLTDLRQAGFLHAYSVSINKNSYKLNQATRDFRVQLWPAGSRSTYELLV